MTHKVALTRNSRGQVVASFTLPLLTMGSMRRTSHKVQEFLTSDLAKNLECESIEVSGGRSFSVVLNPSLNPNEMPSRLKGFKLGLKCLVGQVKIVTDYSGLH